MFISVLLIEAGALFIYAGIKGLSITKLITGDNQTKATLPQGAINPQNTPPASGGGG
jgi:hypothetical protein